MHDPNEPEIPHRLFALSAVQIRDCTSEVLRFLALDTRDTDRLLPQLLQVALSHRSHFGLKPPGYAGLPDHLLEALRTGGGSALMLNLMLASFEAGVGETASQIYARTRGLRKEFSTWPGQQRWLCRAAVLGDTYQGQEPPESVLEEVALQIIGACSLLNKETAAQEFTKNYIKNRPDLLNISVRTVDLKHLLIEQVKPLKPLYDYQTHGPDHDRRYEVTVQTADGRRASGRGTSKRMASNKAAENYLREHYPRSLEAPEPQRRKRSHQINHTLPHAHARTVQRLSRIFNVQPQLAHLLSEALTHSSWLFEHKNRFPDKLDNKVLALVGSQVQDLIYKRSIVQSYLRDWVSWGEFKNHSLAAEKVANAYDMMELNEGFLIGRTHDKRGPSIEMRSDALQAVLAVVLISSGSIKQVEERLLRGHPATLDAIAPGRVIENDPTTDLQEFLEGVAEIEKLEWSEIPIPHSPSPRYSCTFTLKGPGDDDEVTVTGSYATSKTRARNKTAEIVLRAARSLQKIPQTSIGDQQTHAICKIVIRGFILGVPTRQGGVRRWMRAGHLGVDFLEDTRVLREWTRQISTIYGSRLNREDITRIAEFYRVARQVNGAPLLPLKEHLDEVADWIARLDHQPKGLREKPQWNRLLALCNGFRIRTVRGEDRSLADVFAQATSMDSARMTTVHIPDAMLSTQSADALVDIIEFWLAGPAEIDPPPLPSIKGSMPTVKLEFPFSTTASEYQTLIDLARTASAAAIGISFTIRPDLLGLEIVNIGAPGARLSLENAVLESEIVPAEPIDFALAHTLHDLKNLLTAANVADHLMKANPDCADKHAEAMDLHVEQAQEIGSRLGKTASLLAGSVIGSTELTSFFDSYVHRKAGALPSSIEMVVSRTPAACNAAIHSNALMRVLDNLVQNSIEAMRDDGGRVGIEWIEDKAANTILVAVCDDGPGIPEPVMYAIQNGQEIRSAKPGGNGLGLHSVMAVLRRIGGQLNGFSGGSGTSWYLELPSANPGPEQ